MISSVIIDPAIEYPSSEDFFSPDEAYPEYALGRVSGRPNPVYRAVRNCLAQAGLDAARFGTPDWNPLRSLIAEGSRAFILCNFVYHRRESESLEVFWSKCTHGSVLRAVLDYVMLAVGPLGTVSFGNAPIQSCDWERVLAETGADRVCAFYRDQVGRPVQACDLRSYVVQRGALGGLSRVAKPVDARDEIEVDLGSASLLDELYAGARAPKFRSLDYNPAETDRYHDKGRHVYVINRRILEAQVIVSIPKLKVHEKVGATLGIKGCVGSIAHKHCLAHFRLGSSASGGDEYQGCKPLNILESRLGEYLNKMEPSRTQGLLRTLNFILRKVNLRLLRRSVGGGWAGNDTSWRMSMDIARILTHATETGALADSGLRRHLAFIDGILAGEGQGPLAPTPRRAGFLLFADDVPAGDYAACRFMGIDPERLPIVQRAFGLKRYPLTETRSGEVSATVNGALLSNNDLRSWRVKKFTMPHDWR